MSGILDSHLRTDRPKFASQKKRRHFAGAESALGKVFIPIVGPAGVGGGAFGGRAGTGAQSHSGD